MPLFELERKIMEREVLELTENRDVKPTYNLFLTFYLPTL